MGLRRYITLTNWYSNHVEILLQRNSDSIQKDTIRRGHSILPITEENITDSQRFESKQYTEIYRRMLRHGDCGIYGYIDGKCACRCWGQIKPSEQYYFGEDLHMREDGIYIHYVETAKDSRRQGIAKECLTELIDRFHNKVIYVMVDMENDASMALHKGLGFQEIAVLYIRKRRLKERTKVHWITR